ncbi:MAG: DUF1266 domain-containing protein [Polyangiales bacterium]
MWPIVVGVVALALVAFAAWFFWPVSSRRKREQAAPATRFHWGVVASYMGNADPTLLPAEEAARILTEGWSCPDVGALRRKMEAYRAGEINPAFDVARIVWLAELGVAAGWMPLEERASWSTAALARLRGAYPGWQPFAEELWNGRLRWWSEVARAPMPEGDRARAMEVRGEAAPVWNATPWGA